MMTSRRWWRIKIRCTLLGGGKQEGNSRRIQRHRTLNRNANVLTKSEILRNAARLRTSSTCPENLRPVTEFSSWNIHPAYLRPVHITLPSPLPSSFIHSLTPPSIAYYSFLSPPSNTFPSCPSTNSTSNLWADPLFPRKFFASFRITRIFFHFFLFLHL